MPIVLIALPLVWLYLVFVAAPLPEQEMAGGKSAIRDARLRLGRMNRGEYVVLIAFLTAAFLWIFRRDIDLGGGVTIPGWWRWVTWEWNDLLGRPLSSLPGPIAKLLGQDIGDAAVAIAVGGGLLLIPVTLRPMRFALGARQASRISWDMLVLLGGGFALAYGIQQSGLSNWIATLLKGRTHLEPFVALLLVCYITTALTEVASNVATTSILLPLVAASAEGFGLHPAPLMFATTLSASFGFMLPAGTPPNAIVFSSGYITVPQMARSGLIVDVCGALLIATACYWLAPWALGLR